MAGLEDKPQHSGNGQGDDAPFAGDPSGAAEPLHAAVAEHEALKDKLLRAHAELDNYRKRVQREREEDRKYAAWSLARDLLPVLDNLQRAVDASAKGGTIEDLRQGVQMVVQQAGEAFARNKIEAIPAKGEHFDPNLHEAITQMPSDQPPLTILQEVEKGYKLHDRVLRPSKVIVAASSK